MLPMSFFCFCVLLSCQIWFTICLCPQAFSLFPGHHWKVDARKQNVLYFRKRSSLNLPILFGIWLFPFPTFWLSHFSWKTLMESAEKINLFFACDCSLRMFREHACLYVMGCSPFQLRASMEAFNYPKRDFNR